jgi:hypothetical protein
LIGVQAADAAQTNVAPSDALAEYREQQLQRMVKEVQLTDDQQTRLRAIYREEDESARKWNVQYQAAMSNYMAATRGKDPDARQRAQDAMRDMSAQRNADSQASRAKVRAVVTDAKWMTWLTSQLTESWMGKLAAAHLTEQQKAKLKTLCAESVQTQESTTNAAVRATAYRQLTDAIQNTMLSAQQRDDVATDAVMQRVMRHLPDVDITAEQKAKIKTMCQEAARAAQPAGATSMTRPSLHASREVEKKVMDQVFTAAQREAIEGARLSAQISYSFAACDPSPEQVARMKAMCQEAAKGWTAATDYNVRTAKRKEVAEAIRKTVLTDVQRARLPSAP